MDPSEPHGRPPPPPEHPTPTPPAWLSGDGQTGEGPPAWATRGPWPPPPLPPTQPLPPVPPAPRRRRTGWVLAVVAALAAALVAGVLALRPGVRVEPAPRPPAQGAAAHGAGARATADPRVEVPKLLAKRANAVLHGDRAAFLATVDPRRATWYRKQARLFTAMRTVPFSAIQFQVTDPTNFATATLKRRYAPDRVYLPRVQLRYRFTGQDASPVLGRLSYTFVLTRSGWRIGGQDNARDDAQIWDAGPVSTQRATRTLVVYHRGSERLAGRLLRAAERGYGEVAATWTGRWERKVVILVPRDQDEAEKLVHARDLSPIAALSASSVESGPGGRVLGNRIVVNSTVLAPYRDIDLQNVVTHEMTHVATRTLGNVPLFLVEGFAEYTALRPYRRFPLSSTRPALAQRVRAGRFDGRLPSAAELRGRDGVVAYDEASTFCAWVAETYGEGRLRELYRVFAGSRPPTPSELDLGFREVLGVSRRTAEARWAAWVRARLGG
jgi:hypothetical protein